MIVKCLLPFFSRSFIRGVMVLLQYYTDLFCLGVFSNRRLVCGVETRHSEP